MRPARWPDPSTTPNHNDGSTQLVRVTHPFHPWYGQEFRFVALRRAWGRERVEFLDEQDQLLSLPADWTDAARPDVFVEMAAGRCPFRLDDLLSLAVLLEGLGSPTTGV